MRSLAACTLSLCICHPCFLNVRRRCGAIRAAGTVPPCRLERRRHSVVACATEPSRGSAPLWTSNIQAGLKTVGKLRRVSGSNRESMPAPPPPRPGPARDAAFPRLQGESMRCNTTAATATMLAWPPRTWLCSLAPLLPPNFFTMSQHASLALPLFPTPCANRDANASTQSITRV